MGRDLPVGADGRREIEKGQADNQDNNERIKGIIREHNPSIDTIKKKDILKVKLWEQLSDDPCSRFCPFSGQKIGIANLFSPAVQIEHLIPFSQSLDDSTANKTLCTVQANLDKGNKTPYEAFFNHPKYNWQEIMQRVSNLPESKHWRFQQDAREIWQRDHEGFSERHINDTRYIGRLAKEYLQNICRSNRIDVVTGRLTALLRGHWGLNSVLSNDKTYKNRDDHRHHAVDAIVIGMTNKSTLRQVSTAANMAEAKNLESLFEDNKAIDPWPGFRRDVREAIDNIVVSHKPNRKKPGQLHNETAYGIIGENLVVHRQPVEKFDKLKDIEAISGKNHRQEFLAAWEFGGKEAVQQLARQKGIRSLRYVENLKVIPIKDKNGIVYKGYKGDSNWGMEIYQYPHPKKEGKWEGVVISRFDANQKSFIPGFSHRPHPAAKLIMCLHINDCIAIGDENNRQIMRVQYISKSDKKLFFAPLHESNVDKRHRDKTNAFRYTGRTTDQLQRANAKQAHISPTGLVRLM